MDKTPHTSTTKNIFKEIGYCKENIGFEMSEKKATFVDINT